MGVGRHSHVFVGRETVALSVPANEVAAAAIFFRSKSKNDSYA